MTFKDAAILGSYISKDYAEDLFRLLATYRDISASEAASRLNLHIRTVQDFLEAMAGLGILEREEVYEGKRPYYRYRLLKRKISMDIDLSDMFGQQVSDKNLDKRIRERKNAGARFSVSRNNLYISSVIIWTGEGRDRKERKINLSIPQGKFLFHLPFPSADCQSIREIIMKAGIENENISEIIDIVKELTDMEVIESDNKQIQK